MSLAADRRDRGHQPLGVGVERLLDDWADAADLDDLAGVHDADAIGQLGVHRQVVADDQDRNLELSPEIAEGFEDDALDVDVERGRRFVGDDQLRVHRDRGGDDDTLLHPAAQLVWVQPGDALLQSDPLQQAGYLSLCLPFGDAVRGHPVDNLRADAHDRVERVHRTLRDVRDLLPAETAHLVLGEPHQVDRIAPDRVEADAAARDPIWEADDLEDRLDQRRFAGARLAGDADDLVAIDRQTRAVDDAGDTAGGLEVDFEVLDLQQHVVARSGATAFQDRCRSRCYAHLRCLAGAAARRLGRRGRPSGRPHAAADCRTLPSRSGSTPRRGRAGSGG
jgi:hypothetical protein